MQISLMPFPSKLDIAGRNNYSGTAPECVERQRNNGKAVIAGEEKQIAQWKAIVESVQA